MAIIDVHAHWGKWRFPVFSSFEKLLALLEEFNIEKILLSSAKAILYDPREGNEELREVVEKDQRLLMYIVLNPNYPEISEGEMEKYKDDSRVVGIKFHPSYSGQRINSPATLRLVERALEGGYRLFLFHTYSGGEVADLGETARGFPEGIFIMAHMGGVAWEEGISIAKEQKNIYLEICSSLSDRGKVERAVAEVGYERILYGSDLTLLTPAFALGMVLGADINDIAKEHILFKNASRILDSLKRR